MNVLYLFKENSKLLNSRMQPCSQILRTWADIILKHDTEIKAGNKSVSFPTGLLIK